ncbi:MAG TPA: LuxR C-terminal-related transcriptional regulator [Negativicutes bacterium]|nr:LuxR C-terminal-related transcriptional regulator [Negativicutes bacterium]
MTKTRRHDTKNLYFSKRITEAMGGIFDHPLTIVEAPMGYGKTTAIREFLRNSQSQVLWQPVYDSEPSSFWQDFGRLFAAIDEDCTHSLLELGFPHDGVLLQEAMRILADVTFSDATFLVIDDYHLIVSREINSLVERVAMNGIPGLHIVLITRYIGQLNVEELALKGYLHLIAKETLELTPQEIAEYYRVCGISLDEEEIQRLHALTEGWISALYLFMLELRSHGSYTPEANIYKLIEKTVYDPFAAETKEFLLTMSLFDSFTHEQAAYMWGNENVDELLAEVTGQNAFINYDYQNKTYFVHNILTGFLRERLASQAPDYRRTLWRKAAGWLEKNGEYFTAMRYYYECGDFDSLLLVLEEDRSHDFTAAKKETIKKYMAECPQEAKSRHHYAVLKYMVHLFVHHETALFGKTCGEFISQIKADANLTIEQHNRLLGEFELILGFTAYNDIPKMEAHFANSWALLGQATAVYDPKLNWTFGSPSVLYLYYRESGRMDEHVRDLIKYMPDYNRLTGGHGSGGEHIMEGEWLFNQGDFTGAEIAAYKALYKAQAANQPNIVFCGEYLLIRIAFLQGDGDRVFELLQKMREEMMDKKDYQLIHLVEICEGNVYAALKQKNKIPASLMDADPKNLRLGFPGFGAFNIFYGRALLVSGEYLKLIGSAEYFFGIAAVFSNLLGKIYTHIYLAAAHHVLFRETEALDQLQRALDIALPDTLYMPFAENGDYIKPLLEKLYNEGYCCEDLATILELCVVYEKAAEQIVREHCSEEKPKLTERELEIAQLAAEGITNKEIGAQLYISENTVKMALKSVFEKLGVSSRALLRQNLLQLK